MKLFEIDIETGTVALNKPWIMLIPEFKVLLDRDKGSAGDYRGDKKLKARKEFTYIYFLTDFSSPITDWEEGEKLKEALYYAGLEQKDIDDKVNAANNKYDEIQLKGARALRTYRSLLKSQDAMDQYYEDLDMTKTDKMGKLLNDPGSVVKSAKELDAFYTTINNFRKRVEEELKDQTKGIRGTASLGDNEEKTSKFSEADIIAGSQHAAEGSTTGTGTFNSMGLILQKIEKHALTEAEIGEEDLEDGLS
jgi:hypothetical protein